MEKTFIFSETDVFSEKVSPNKKYTAMAVNNGLATALLLFEKEKIDFSKPYVHLLIHDSHTCPLKMSGVNIKWSQDSNRAGIFNNAGFLFGVIDLEKGKKVGATVILGYILALDNDIFKEGIPDNIGDPLDAEPKPKRAEDVNEIDSVFFEPFISPDGEYMATLVDNGERGLIFYFKYEGDTFAGEAINIYSIYNKIDPPIQKRGPIEIKWSSDNKKIGLFINGVCYAVIDITDNSFDNTKTINSNMMPIEGVEKIFEPLKEDDVESEANTLISKVYSLSSTAPSGKKYALFYDDGINGVLRIFQLDSQKLISKELTVFPFYNKIFPTIEKHEKVEIIWTRDSSRMAVVVNRQFWAIVDFKTKRKLGFDVQNGKLVPINPVVWTKGIPKNRGIPI